MLRKYEQIRISMYSGIYDAIVGKDHVLRKIKDSIDFSFVNPMLKQGYSENMGRPAKEPELMFKLMFLKKLYDLSDREVINDAKVNMAYKYFLGLNPEDELPDASLLTVFRKLRITEDILNDMLKETVRQAIEKKLIKSNTIIVDATHSKSRTGTETPTEALRRMTKSLRSEIYTTQYDLSDKFPEKPDKTAPLEDEMTYTKALLVATKDKIEVSGSEKAKELVSQIEEAVSACEKGTQSLADPDAKVGHKDAESSFLGYKTHIAMTEERVITAIEVTSGEVNDGVYLQKLTEQSKSSGIEVKEIIGDTAYPSKKNLDYAAENGIKIVSRLHPVITNAQEKNDGFIFNKDAGTMQCPAGCLAGKKKLEQRENGKNDRMRYYFGVKQCKDCPLRSSCIKSDAKRRSYSVTILSEAHAEQKAFQESDYFKERIKQRYMIEAKNAELKQTHGLKNADSVGLVAMRLQSFFTAFVVNVKRIVKLEELSRV